MTATHLAQLDTTRAYGRAILTQAELGRDSKTHDAPSSELAAVAAWLRGRSGLDIPDQLPRRGRGVAGLGESPGDYGRLLATVPLDSRSVAVPALTVAMIHADVTPGRGARDPFGALEAALSSGAQLVVAPEWFFPYCATPQAFTSVMARLLAMTRGHTGLLVPGTVPMVDRQGRYRNVAMAISDGRSLLTYAKRSNGGDRTFAVRHGAQAWEPGVRAGCFAWEGLRVGLEVCADHNAGRLRWDQLRAVGEPLDLQIVVACGTAARKHAVATGQGGALICVDGSDSGETGAHRVVGGALELRHAPLGLPPLNDRTIVKATV